MEKFWIDGLKQPVRYRGMGSFINREERSLGKEYYKNCVFLKERCPKFSNKPLIVIKAITNIKVGDELLTVYGKGYRISKH